jgi:hypothetical protein
MTQQIDHRIATRNYTTFPLQRYWLCDTESTDRLWDYETAAEARSAMDRCLGENMRTLVWDSETGQVVFCTPRRG